MLRLHLLIGIALGLGVGLSSVADGGPPQAPPPRRIPVEELVERLGVGEVADREEAERRLSALAVEPPAEVLAALKSKNLDQRDRAKRIAQAMHWNVVATKLPRGQRFAEEGKFDLFVAATAAWDLKPDDDRLWVPAVDLGHRLVDKAGLKGDRQPHHCPCTFKDYAAVKRNYHPRFTRVDELYVRLDPRQEDPPRLLRNDAIQARGVDSPTGLTGSLIVSRGTVRVPGLIQNSVIFANGDVTTRGLFVGIIVCDGDVAVDGGVTMGFVVARGDITITQSTSFATLIAGGKVTIRAQTKGIEEGRAPAITENEPNPLGYVTFFELHRVGLEVKAAEKVVSVAKVVARSAAEKAGLKAGDVVLEVGGKKPDSAESLRRLLRDALAVGDAAVKIKRGDEALTAKLSLPE